MLVGLGRDSISVKLVSTLLRSTKCMQDGHLQVSCRTCRGFADEGQSIAPFRLVSTDYKDVVVAWGIRELPATEIMGNFLSFNDTRGHETIYRRVLASSCARKKLCWVSTFSHLSCASLVY